MVVTCCICVYLCHSLTYFTFICDQDCKPEIQMMYAGSKNSLVKTIDVTKVNYYTYD